MKHAPAFQSFKIILLTLAIVSCTQNVWAGGNKLTHNDGAAPEPTNIYVGPISGSLSACTGSPSQSPYIERFILAGYFVTGNVIATASTGFEVSLSPGSGYGTSVTLIDSAGVADAKTVYVRLGASSSPGTVSGDVTITSKGKSYQKLTLTGKINGMTVTGGSLNQTVLSGSVTAGINFMNTGTVNWVNDNPGIGLSAAGSGDIASFKAINSGTSPKTATITATPASVSARFVYVAHQNSATVSAIDATAFQNGSANGYTIAVGKYPAGVAASSDGNRVYVVNSGSNDISVINTATNNIVATVPVGVSPQFAAVSLDNNRVYVTNFSGNSVSVIDAASNSVIGTIAVGTEPQGIAVSPDGSRVYVANYIDHDVSVINTLTNMVVATIPVGLQPFGVLVSPDGSKVYVANLFSASVSVINTATNAVQTTIGVGLNPSGLSITPDGNQVYVTNNGDGTVSVINTKTNLTTTIRIGGVPFGISVSPDGLKVCVLHSSSNYMSVISTVTNTLINTIALGRNSYPSSFGNFITKSVDCTGIPITFTIKVNALQNVNLSNLSISSGTLTPVFSPAITSYTDTVSNFTTAVQLTPTNSNIAATIKVNGIPVTSGTASASIPLTVAPTTIHIVVLAQDGAQRTYTVTVSHRSNNANLAGLTVSSGVLSPTFAAGTTSYAETVSHATDFFSVTPTTSDANATLKVNGTTVASGAASPRIYLQVGDNYIHTVVTAQDGTLKTYTVVVTRPSNGLSTNANLANLTISNGTLSPAFFTPVTSYATLVSPATSSVTLTPTTSGAGATVKVNGTIVASGTPSSSVPLSLFGPNAINIAVTAQDGSVRTYTVTVTRISNIANLANLAISSGTLSPAFTTANTSYTATVSNATTAVTVNPTTSDVNATVKVDGTPVTSGSASGSISLAVGNNAIHAVVTATDGTKRTYTVTVHRLSTGGLNSLYLPGNGEHTTLISSLNQKVEANNILTPNSDGINDIWVVKNIAFYPNNTVSVYDRSGKIVFTKKGYANDWAGTYRGSVLNTGTYYYSVDLGNGSVIKGFITVINNE